MIDIAKALGLKPDAPANREEVREQRREFERSLKPLVEDAHARLDASVEVWRYQLKAQVRTASRSTRRTSGTGSLPVC
jgi:hypothetical protein